MLTHVSYHIEYQKQQQRMILLVKCFDINMDTVHHTVQATTGGENFMQIILMHSS